MRFIFMVFGCLWCLTAWSASHDPQAFVEGVAGHSKEGEKIVQQYCALCHAENPQIALGAPRAQNQSDWKLRVQQGLQVLLQHVSEGYQGMPARGGCFECTDEQLLLAIQTLLPPD